MQDKKLNVVARPTPYQFSELFIGGRWRSGQSVVLQDHNPFNGDLLGEFAQASTRDVDDAFEAAVMGQTLWANALPSERAAVLRRAVDIMDLRQAEITD